MPDIDMCSTPDCPLAETCYRKQAVPTPEYQWYGEFQFAIQPDGECWCEDYEATVAKSAQVEKG